MSDAEVHLNLDSSTDGASQTTLFRPDAFEGILTSGAAKVQFPRVRDYEILSVIGSGGMGIVFKARHRHLNRIVALKMLRGAAFASPEIRARFQAEAEAVARLQHPNIIQAFEIGAIEPKDGDLYPSPFIALEFVDGGSLIRLTERPQSPKSAAEMVEKLARAVYSAHRLGVVHRDLKPANVLLTPDGEPKIADFGIAKLLGNERDDSGRSLTQVGDIVGTPEYMAPEQAKGAAPTTAFDIYALGAILYELLTSRVPFRAETPIETLSLLQLQDAVPPRQFRPGLPRDLETICLKCLEKEPGKRYATAIALADDLRNFLEDRPIRARRHSDIERMVRWCRRNPLVGASLAGVVCIFLIAFVLVSLSYWRAEAAWHEEAKQRLEAEKKERAERWERYRANIVATASALQVYNVDAARRTLQDSPEEYRNWEWRHFQSRLDQAHRVLRAEDASFTGAAIAASGRRVALFGEDGFARVWNTANCEVVRTFRKLPDMIEVTLSPDGNFLAFARRDNSVVIRDLGSGRVLSVLRGHDQAPHTLKFTRDSQRLVTASDDKTLRVWNVLTGEAIRVLHPHRSSNSCMRISEDGRRAVVSDKSRVNVCLLDLDTGEVIASLAWHESGLHNACFDPSGDRFVTTDGFPSNELRMWSAKTGKLLRVMGRHDNTVMEMAFNSDGTRLATCSMDQTVCLWDGVTGEAIATLQGHCGRVNCVAFSPDGKRLISGSLDRTVRLWDAGKGSFLAVMSGHSASVQGVGYSADGHSIVSYSTDSTIRLWDAQLVENLGVLRGHTKFVYSVVYHPDGKQVVSAGWDGTVRVWDLATGKQRLLLNHGDKAIVSSVAIHPTGLFLASRARGMVYLWDLTTGQELHRWNAPSDEWRDTRLAFSPNGDLLATGCRDGSIRMWDVKSRAEAVTLEGHRDVVRDVAFSPDGKWLASAGEIGDKTVRIWNVATKTQAHELKGHQDCVYALAFTPDGRQLASGSIDGTVRLWDTDTWQETAILKLGTIVYGLAFSPDQTRLACACADNSIRLWEMSTHQSVAELRGHTDYVHSVAFSPDGTKLVSASGDFTVRIWDTIRPQDRADTP